MTGRGANRGEGVLLMVLVYVYRTWRKLLFPKEEIHIWTHIVMGTAL